MDSGSEIPAHRQRPFLFNGPAALMSPSPEDQLLLCSKPAALAHENPHWRTLGANGYDCGFHGEVSPSNPNGGKVGDGAGAVHSSPKPPALCARGAACAAKCKTGNANEDDVHSDLSPLGIGFAAPMGRTYYLQKICQQTFCTKCKKSDSDAQTIVANRFYVLR